MKLKLNWEWTMVSIKQVNGEHHAPLWFGCCMKAKQTNPQPIVMSDLSTNPTAKLLLNLSPVFGPSSDLYASIYKIIW